MRLFISNFKNAVRNYISFWYKKESTISLPRERPFRDLP